MSEACQDTNTSQGTHQRLPDFRDAARERILIGDGAMATLLHQSGVPVRACYEELCLTHPQYIHNVHVSYIQAGAQWIQTNTFSAHRAGLLRFGLEDKLVEMNSAAVKVAREAARNRVYVFGTIGSILGLRAYATLEDVGADELAAQFAEQAHVLLKEGVDGLLLETFADLGELTIALRTVRGLTDLPILCHLSPDSVGVTRDGVPLTQAFADLTDAGADVVGLNCRLGPSGILRSYEGAGLKSEVLYSAVPNAGTLHVVEGDYSYTGSSRYFADMLLEMYRLGVRVFGGCCGTTPDHIRELSRVFGELQVDEGNVRNMVHVETANSTDQSVQSQITGENVQESQRPGGVRPAEPHLVHLVRDDVTVIVELDPPRSLDVQKFLDGAIALRNAGADFVTLADNSLGTVRVSNMALASMLKNLGVEPLVHITCRDRNLIGQQSHLMGLHVLGIHHILLVTGDPSRFGDLPGATSVYDVSSTELTRMVKRLNGGTAFSGQPLKKPSRFIIGTSFNPHVANFDKAVQRLYRKIEAGADYVMTQPIYDQRLFERIAKAVENLDVPVFMGVMPLVSARNAIFLHNEVPGIQIPEALLQRMISAGEAHAAEEGLCIAKELIDVALQYFRGLYLITPFLRYELTVELTRYIHQSASAIRSNPFTA